jgi:hypothetical protein
VIGVAAALTALLIAGIFVAGTLTPLQGLFMGLGCLFLLFLFVGRIFFDK